MSVKGTDDDVTSMTIDAPVTSPMDHGLRPVWLIGASWLFVGSIIATICSLAQGIFMARKLGTVDYGTLTIVISFGALINQFFDARSWEVIVKFVDGFLKERNLGKAAATIKLCFLIDLIMGLITYAVIIVSATFISEVFTRSAINSSLLKIFALTVLMSIPTGTAIGLLRLKDKFISIAIQDIIFPVLQLFGVLFLLMREKGLREIIFLFVFISSMKTIVGMWLASDVYKEVTMVVKGTDQQNGKLSCLKDDFRRIIRFIFATSGFTTLRGIQRNGDSLLVAYFLGPASAGIWRIARNFAEMMNFPIAPLYQATYPQFIRLWHMERKTELRHLWMKLTVISTAIAVGGVGMIFIWGNWVILRTVGQAYLNAGPLLNINAIGMGILIVSQFGHSILMGAGRGGDALRAFAIPLLFQVILMFILLPVLGLMGAAVSFMIFHLIRGGLLLNAGSCAIKELRYNSL